MRLHCTTTKLKTGMGAVYIHTDHDERGRGVGVAISYAGKLMGSAIGKTLDRVAITITNNLRASPRPPEVKLGKSGDLPKLPPAGPNPAGGFLCPEP